MSQKGMVSLCILHFAMAEHHKCILTAIGLESGISSVPQLAPDSELCMGTAV